MNVDRCLRQQFDNKDAGLAASAMQTSSGAMSRQLYRTGSDFGFWRRRNVLVPTYEKTPSKTIFVVRVSIATLYVQYELWKHGAAPITPSKDISIFMPLIPRVRSKGVTSERNILKKSTNVRLDQLLGRDSPRRPCTCMLRLLATSAQYIRPWLFLAWMFENSSLPFLPFKCNRDTKRTDDHGTLLGETRLPLSDYCLVGCIMMMVLLETQKETSKKSLPGNPEHEALSIDN